MKKKSKLIPEGSRRKLTGDLPRTKKYLWKFEDNLESDFYLLYFPPLYGLHPYLLLTLSPYPSRTNSRPWKMVTVRTKFSFSLFNRKIEVNSPQSLWLSTTGILLLKPVFLLENIF